MPRASGAVVQGTLDILVLKTLSLEPLHGFGITARIEGLSGGVFRVNAGSLFAAFRRLERGGLVRSDWRTTSNNRRAKYYALTARGRKKLALETTDWQRQIAAIATILSMA